MVSPGQWMMEIKKRKKWGGRTRINIYTYVYGDDEVSCNYHGKRGTGLRVPVREPEGPV